MHICMALANPLLVCLCRGNRKDVNVLQVLHVAHGGRRRPNACRLLPVKFPVRSLCECLQSSAV